MAIAKDITGQRFSSLLVVGYSERKTKANKRIVWCRCDCGSLKEQIAANLVNGGSKSCGCSLVETAKKNFTKHGNRSHEMYHRYNAMMQRCYNEKNHEYKNYGARGITVCDSWKNSIESYILDMGKPPFKGASIDRIDNDKGYSKENCQWATKKQQSENRRVVKLIEFNGKKMCIGDWEKELGFGSRGIRGRLEKGASINEAFTTPKWKFKS